MHGLASLDQFPVVKSILNKIMDLLINITFEDGSTTVIIERKPEVLRLLDNLIFNQEDPSLAESAVWLYANVIAESVEARAFIIQKTRLLDLV